MYEREFGESGDFIICFVGGNAIISLLIMALQIPKAEGDLFGNVLLCDEKAKGKKRYIYIFKYSGVMEA